MSDWTASLPDDARRLLTAAIELHDAALYAVTQLARQRTSGRRGNLLEAEDRLRAALAAAKEAMR